MPTPKNSSTGQRMQPNMVADDDFYARYTDTVSMVASHAMKDGVSGKGIFLPDAFETIKRYKPTLGHKVMDIIMFHAGKNHPLVVAGRIREGHPVHITWVYIHKSIGVNNDWFICPARTYGRPCPACEKRAAILSDPKMSDEEAKNAAQVFNTGKYPVGIYNVIFHSNPRDITWSEPVMIWDINNVFMEAELQSKAVNPMGGGYINYAWPTAGPNGGRHISFEIVQKGAYLDYRGHEFHIRQTPVPKHVLEQAVCIDDLLYVPTYDEIKAAIDMGADTRHDQPDFDIMLDKHAPATTASGILLPFADCAPLGSMFDSFAECATCDIRLDCLEAAGGGAEPAPPDSPQAETQPEPMVQPTTQTTHRVIPKRPTR